MSDNAHVITVRSISFHYPATNNGAALPVLRDITLSVERGEFVCVLGQSGCGKSTLLQLIAGLLQPSVGEVVLFRPSGQLPCTLMFQDLHLFYWQTAQRNVEIVLQCRGLGKKEIASQALNHLEQVGLGSFARHYPHELSGGMRQRLAVARVLATDAPTYLLDEPFGNLDMVTERSLEVDFLRIQAERGLSVLMVTHDVRKALRMADRIVLLSPRPATIYAEYRIDLPRPRHGEVEFSPEFQLMEKQLCEVIMTSTNGPAMVNGQCIRQG